MAFFSCNLCRPLSAMAAVIVAAVSSEFPVHISHTKPSDTNFTPSSSSEAPSQVHQARVSQVSNGLVSLLDKKPLSYIPDSLFSVFPFPTMSPAVLQTSYHYANLANPSHYDEGPTLPSIPPSKSDTLYRWHLPNPKADRVSRDNICSKEKSKTVVVLLGWLGAKQRHLSKYAQWYTSRGFHVVTFTFPMADIMSYKVGGKVEQNIELLADHLADWVAEENGKNLVFHTFSNTGWLTYGVLLEKFQKQDPSVVGRIKGCIVDSAPVASPDPRVWASGFSAAFLKKQSVATHGGPNSNSLGIGMTVAAYFGIEAKPEVVEAALLTILEKFFEVVLNFPSINGRLTDVFDRLASNQPKCPQLYMYSSSDRVIPAISVESFVEGQRKAGLEVRACDFLSSPHVDHFRSHPDLYSSQLTSFLEDCVLTCCKRSSKNKVKECLVFLHLYYSFS